MVTTTNGMVHEVIKHPQLHYKSNHTFQLLMKVKDLRYKGFSLFSQNNKITFSLFMYKGISLEKNGIGLVDFSLFVLIIYILVFYKCYFTIFLYTFLCDLFTNFLFSNLKK